MSGCIVQGTKSMQVLVDQSVERYAVIRQTYTTIRTVNWGGHSHEFEVAEAARILPGDIEQDSKKSQKNKDLKDEIAYLARIATLARQNTLKLFSCFELRAEAMRHSAIGATLGQGAESGYLGLNLLDGVNIKNVPPPATRTMIIGAGITFGVRKDEQIEAFRELQNRYPRFSEIAGSISKKKIIDAFHVWTAEHNSLDAFVTLDFALKRALTQAEKESRLHLDIEVLTPKELCHKIGEPPYDLDAILQENPPFR